ncbi:MAG TPA: VOC family protein [Chloroflexota bacterium]|nr:VOC family protein [Chloroflexota bacterium]
MTEPTFAIPKIDQVGIVVRDLRWALQHYVSVLGIGPWRVYRYGSLLVRRMTFRGQPADFELHLAFCQTPSVQLELIEPTRGPSLHFEFLEKKGEGIHHFGTFVPNLDEAIVRARAAGIDVLMSGHGTGPNGDGGFAYLGTEGTLSALFELIEAPSVRYPPEEVYGEL